MKTNSELQTDVQNAIKREPLLHAAEIGVTAHDGVVSLTGVVDSYVKKMEAENATKKVIGVKAVVEKIEVKKLASLYAEENPKCPNCGKHMKSAGQGQGLRCKKCSIRTPSKIRYEVKRGLEVGLYEVPPCARRHLAKPLVREKRSETRVYPSR